MTMHDINLVFWPTVIACLAIGVIGGYVARRHHDR